VIHQILSLTPQGFNALVVAGDLRLKTYNCIRAADKDLYTYFETGNYLADPRNQEPGSATKQFIL
jgi:hypothetical protein